ncbi:hypothetical protein ACXX9E_29360 [Pseudomonas sp. GNP014]
MFSIPVRQRRTSAQAVAPGRQPLAAVAFTAPRIGVKLEDQRRVTFSTSVTFGHRRPSTRSVGQLSVSRSTAFDLSATSGFGDTGHRFRLAHPRGGHGRVRLFLNGKIDATVGSRSPSASAHCADRPVGVTAASAMASSVAQRITCQRLVLRAAIPSVEMQAAEPQESDAAASTFC